MQIRNATPCEIRQLSELWYDGWRDAHADLLPVELRRFRTRESFCQRMEGLLPLVRVAVDDACRAGFHIVRDAELYQLYVSADRRGAGIAAHLMKDAESVLRSNGIRTAWLACAIGNTRAARFYQKQGWRPAGIMRQATEIRGGTFPLEVWRFERDIR